MMFYCEETFLSEYIAIGKTGRTISSCLFMLFHKLFTTVQIDCIITTLLCTHKLNKQCKKVWDF